MNTRKGYENPGYDFVRAKREGRPLTAVKILSDAEVAQMARPALAQSLAEMQKEAQRLRDLDKRNN